MYSQYVDSIRILKSEEYESLVSSGNDDNCDLLKKKSKYLLANDFKTYIHILIKKLLYSSDVPCDCDNRICKSTYYNFINVIIKCNILKKTYDFIIHNIYSVSGYNMIDLINLDPVTYVDTKSIYNKHNLRCQLTRGASLFT